MEAVMIVTNNPMSKSEFEGKYEVEFLSGSTMEVYKKTRDYIHKGHKLLTHPLVSSIKPNEIPYRTVAITKNCFNEIDFQSLQYIEEAIQSTEKFLRDFGLPKWDNRVLEDFSVIDYDLIYHALT
ncbi:MAG: GrdX family protein [Solirubrobacterales bacterium]